jgi:hypothetical protein
MRVLLRLSSGGVVIYRALNNKMSVDAIFRFIHSSTLANSASNLHMASTSDSIWASVAADPSESRMALAAPVANVTYAPNTAEVVGVLPVNVERGRPRDDWSIFNFSKFQS